MLKKRGLSQRPRFFEPHHYSIDPYLMVRNLYSRTIINRGWVSEIVCLLSEKADQMSELGTNVRNNTSLVRIERVNVRNNPAFFSRIDRNTDEISREMLFFYDSIISPVFREKRHIFW